jgi:uncharacterized protein (DUF58 family)
MAALAGAPAFVLAYNVALFAAAFVSWRLGPSGAGLTLRRRRDAVLSVRASNRVELLLENDSGEPVEGVLRDEPPPTFEASRKEFPFRLKPGREEFLEYTVCPPERGADAFRGTFLRLKCPMGLVEREAVLDTEEPVRVYPNILALKSFDLLQQQGRLREIGIRRNRSRGLGSEFESLREYAKGDDYRKVDHKASARRGKLVVRQYEQERNQAVILAIDSGRHMLSEVDGVRKLDHVLDALLMLCNAASVAGDLVGLVAFSDEVRKYVPPKKGRAQVTAMIDAVHDLVAEPLESDTVGAMSYLAQRWKRRSLLVLFTDVDHPDRAREVLRALTPLVRRHLILLVRVKDDLLDTLLAEPLRSEDVAFQKAAAVLLDEDRKAATTMLDAAGVHHLDSAPATLAGDLVSYYFDVKSRNLL